MELIGKNQKKRKDKEAFINWVIQENDGKLFSYNTMSKVLGRYENIKEDMIKEGTILRKRMNGFNKVVYGDTVITIFYKSIYSSNSKLGDFSNNPYLRKLKVLFKDKKLNKKESLIISSIIETMSKTTLEGAPLPLTYIKKKGDRIYYDVTNLKKEERKKIKIDGNKTIGIDLSAAQLQLLSKTNFGFGYDNHLFFLSTNSQDIWGDISKKMGISRDKTKEMFITSINGRYHHPEVVKLFPTFFHNLYKYKKEHGYKAISQLYFKLENLVMEEIMLNLALNNINFLPIHDCLIIEEKNYSFVSSLFSGLKLKYKIEY